MKKSVLTLTIAISLGFGSLVTGFPYETTALANTLNDLKSKQNQIQDKRSNINSKIDSADKTIDKLKGQQRDVKQDITQLNMAIEDTQSKILDKREQISVTKAEIKKLEEEIKVLIKRINKRNELLKDRARSFQENGGVVSYVDVLMGAQNFSDFIDRMGAVATIVEADQDILKEHQADKDSLEKKQKEVEDKLAKLEGMLEELKGMESDLKTKKSQKDKLMKELKHKEEEVHAEILSLEEQEDILAGQQAAIQKAMELEKKRLQEEARQRQRQNSGSNGGSGSPSNGGGARPPISSGHFTKPAAGVLTSGLGMRWGSYHAGVDIAQGGTNPVVAAADGVVIQSYRSSSYGEVVFISHSIDGQIYTTVYAHMRSGSRTVSAGQTVKKGQRLGIMGNTGDSQGQHLHFELHRGPWNAAKSNAINPVGIVPL